MACSPQRVTVSAVAVLSNTIVTSNGWSTRTSGKSAGSIWTGCAASAITCVGSPFSSYVHVYPLSCSISVTLAKSVTYSRLADAGCDGSIDMDSSAIRSAYSSASAEEPSLMTSMVSIPGYCPG